MDRRKAILLVLPGAMGACLLGGGRLPSPTQLEPEVAIYSATLPGWDEVYVDRDPLEYVDGPGLAWTFQATDSLGQLPADYDTIAGEPWPHRSQFPPVLLRRLLTSPAIPVHDAGAFPARVTLVDSDSIDAAHPELIFTVYHFSRVVVDADTLNALVYREKTCGGLCGSGELLWLKRSEHGNWRIELELLQWIS